MICFLIPGQSDACTAVNSSCGTLPTSDLFSTSRETGDSLNDCTIILVDEIYKIEEPGTASPISAGTPKRECGVELLHVCPSLCCPASCVCGDQRFQSPSTCPAVPPLAISRGWWHSVSRVCVCPQDRVALCARPARTTQTRPAGSVLVTSVGGSRTQTSSSCVTSVTWPSTSTACSLPSAGSQTRTGRSGEGWGCPSDIWSGAGEGWGSRLPCSIAVQGWVFGDLFLVKLHCFSGVQ